MKTIYNVFVISDSSGQTGTTIAKTAAAQFPEAHANISQYPFIQTKAILTGILKLAKENQAIIFHTLVDSELSDMVTQYAEENGLSSFDCIQTPIELISHRLHESSAAVPGLVHNLNAAYFKRIDAIEFTVANDDGRHPEKLKQADIVILGVSRTSKTPLSLYLANESYKVANVPVGPNIQLPDEIWQLNPKKIFGLTNSITKLQEIRTQRMKEYGIENDTRYSNAANIKEELDYAQRLYQKIGCLCINVADKSIEETASIITESLPKANRPMPPS
ncbi:kinase/pyrophosphorylase [Fructilactobacillus ixorae]|uniref:Putative pyruvate, phosphate dikinase regulatory protein n=1 Tax=Fructilactobacillus ixorae TaxID=1750535 RepID=A0ABY5C4L3_9LACO|nr:pyruvate, water dikinase regulatory protein [Fructilactobacillus ixorae]USS92773.1 kinase/pyrophosphorylase [Fructilactobacillus ixorae]